MERDAEKKIRAPRGTSLTCKGWAQEAMYRMIQNNLENAEIPEELIVYGGTGKAARNWDCYHALLETMRTLEDDETMLVQSGKPVAVFKTKRDAPRAVIVNSLIVPAWATWENFWDYEARGLTMYGQMTAGSWIYIGTQGILQGTYETFAAVAQKHFGGTLEGKLLLTAGMGGMGGAQPLAATMNEGVALVVEVDEKRIRRRMSTRYCDTCVSELGEALDIVSQCIEEKIPRSIGLVGNAAEVHPELVRRNLTPAVVTDQTSAHDALNGYVPRGYALEEALALRKDDPQKYVSESMESMAAHCRAMLEMQKRGAVVFDYGNNLRGQAKKAGVERAFDYP